MNNTKMGIEFEMNLKEENAVFRNSSLFSKANSFTLPKQF
jgi:hypothetical protein